MERLLIKQSLFFYGFSEGTNLTKQKTMSLEFLPTWFCIQIKMVKR